MGTTQIQAAIIDVIRTTRAEHHACTLGAVANALGCSRSWVQQQCAILKASGLVDWSQDFPGSLHLVGEVDGVKPVPLVVDVIGGTAETIATERARRQRFPVAPDGSTATELVVEDGMYTPAPRTATPDDVAQGVALDPDAELIEQAPKITREQAIEIGLLPPPSTPMVTSGFGDDGSVVIGGIPIYTEPTLPPELLPRLKSDPSTFVEVSDAELAAMSADEKRRYHGRKGAHKAWLKRQQPQS